MRSKGRHICILVADRINLCGYIHNNPSRAGIVKLLIDYRWSDYPDHAYILRHLKG